MVDTKELRKAANAVYLVMDEVVAKDLSEKLSSAAQAIDDLREWIDIKDNLPRYGQGSFLAFWENQGGIMLVCYLDIHGNYIISGSSGNTCGRGNKPTFSHWMPLPQKP